jgi:hypothetical protein
MNDPVLNRAMFRPAVGPMSSYGTGIASNVASPDEAARALQTAFQPTGYAGGGQVINGVKHFKGGGENQSGGRSFLGGMFRLPDPETVLAPRRYTPVMQAREDAAALEPATQPMNPEDVIVPRRYGTVRPGFVRSGFYRAGEGSSDATTMDADPNFDLPPSPEWNPESQFGRDVKGLLPKKTTDEEAKDRLKAMSDEIKRKRQMMENVDEVRNAPSTAEGSQIGDYFRSLTPEQLAKREAARAQETADRRTAAEGMTERLPPPAGGPSGGIAAIQVRDAEASRKAAAAAAARFDAGVSPTDVPPSPAAAATPPPADKIGGEKKVDEESGLGKRLTLRIDELKQEREANKAQRRENQLLALMQAGFAAAAGKSSSALSNIAAGGSSGIATLADLEKTRRAEDASLRKEGLELELAKEKMIESGKERAAQRQLTAEQRAVQDRNNQAINLRQAHDSLGSRINSLDTKLLTMSNDPTAAAEVRKTRDELQVKYDALDTALISMFGKQGAMPAATLPVRVISSSPTGK